MAIDVYLQIGADGDGAPVKYMEVELENVLIGHWGTSVSEGGIPTEGVGLKFSKIRVKYSQQRVSGGGGNTVGGWDLATNRIAV